MGVSEQDVAGQVDEIAGVLPEVGRGFHELGGEDPGAEGERPVCFVNGQVGCPEGVEE